MNLPNKLTILRTLMIPVFLFFLLTDCAGDYSKWIAVVVFILASLTDFLDGHIARKYNLVTNFGKFMDPLADKILVISALVLFVELRYIPAWMSIIVIAREFLISGIRMLAAAKGEVIPAGKLGKYKTTSQMIVILIMIIVGNQWYNFYLMLIPIILTLWSGWEYTSKAKHYFMNSK